MSQTIVPMQPYVPTIHNLLAGNGIWVKYNMFVNNDKRLKLTYVLTRWFSENLVYNSNN